MKFTFFAALIAAAVQAKPLLGDLHKYTFEQFVQEHNLNIQSTEEYTMRLVIFESELKRVIAHNNSNATWKETINSKSHMTATEKKASHGRKKGKISRRETQMDLPADFELKPLTQLPPSVDWREMGVASAVKDQGNCGSCWAFSATAMLESHAAIASGQLFDLSPQQIAACAPNPLECGGSGNCNGGISEVAYDYVVKSAGMMEEYQYPYTEYYGVESACAVPPYTSKVSITGFVKLVENSYYDLMNAVARIGPMDVSVDASSWDAYDSGIFNGCNQVNPDSDHAVVLMGYGTENGQGYWLVRNSWSPNWGEKGYIRLHRGDDE
jgi:cathepsin L